jgi:site-specific DNA recombinase
LPPRGGNGQAATGFWDRRRPRHVLTGKVFCGCCGRAAALVGQDYLGCRAAKQAACRNTHTIRRGVIEAGVLAALGGQLMQPELLAEFIAAYNDEWKRLAAETKGQADVHRRERASIERKIANLVDAVASGKASASLLAKIEELEG